MSTCNQPLAALVENALALLRRGDLDRCEQACDQILTLQPNHFPALQLRGIAALQRSDHSRAARWLSAAVAANPAAGPAHSNLAAALLALRKPQESLASCETALRLAPNLAEAWSNHGSALLALGRAEQALVSFERSIELAPTLHDAHFGRGNTLLELHRFEEALASYERALHFAPHVAAALNNKANALLQLQRPAEALAALEQALALSPEFAEALNNRGSALQSLHRSLEALEDFRGALRLRPDFAAAFANMANACLSLGRFDEALDCCDRALALCPDLTAALNCRATALRALNRLEEAADTYARLLAIAPGYEYALGNHLFARAGACDWSGRAAQIATLTAKIISQERVCQPLALLSISDSAALQLQCARRFVADRYPAAAPLARRARATHARVRVAYLSADFHDHPVSYLLAGVIERHDRTAYETYGVWLRRQGHESALHQRMRRAFDQFEDVSGLSDEEVAQRLSAGQIDIAVDLTGHTRGGRLGILASRPAPLQVSFLGYTGTSGADYVDYLIADRFVIPPESAGHYAERIAYLPYTFLPNDDGQSIAAATPRRRDLGLPEKSFVFCAFNNAYKLNPLIFDVWMRILTATPGSVLWLRDGTRSMRANLCREAEVRGVSAERLMFAPPVPAMEHHLARYRAADLFLDTVPYGAHATARDALWVGLPVLTCTGQAFASRVAGSLLTALGLGDLVTGQLHEYESVALRLAASPGELATLRARLLEQRLSSPAFGTDLFRRQLESAYALMWQRHRRGDRPESFAVPPLA